MKQDELGLPEPVEACTQPGANHHQPPFAALEPRANLQGLVVVGRYRASLELRSDLHDLISFVAVFFVLVSVLHNHGATAMPPGSGSPADPAISPKRFN